MATYEKGRRDSGIRVYSKHLRYSPVIITHSNKLYFRIETEPHCITDEAQFRIYFRAVERRLRDSLHVVHTSPVSGYIQPVGLVPHKFYGFSLSNNASYRLTLPEGHVVMTSVQRMHLVTTTTGRVTLSLRSESTSEGQKLLWSKCHGYGLTPEVYNFTLVVGFQGNPRKSQGGFKLLYTFHNWSYSPQKLSSGMFNCSVSYYQDFKKHLHCNLQQECDGREDEGGHCHFSSEACNGSVAIKNKCLHVYGNIFRDQVSSATKQVARLLKVLFRQRVIQLKLCNFFTVIVRNVSTSGFSKFLLFH